VLDSLTDAQWVGFSFVLLGMALICGMLVRRAVPWLAAVYIPTSVLAGVMILVAGPQGLGEVTDGWSLVPSRTVTVLSALPGLLINIVIGGIMNGKTLPSMRRIWAEAAPHAILGGGILTALSVPLILSIGSLTFGLVSAAATVGLIIWGVMRKGAAHP
jgi:ESS family glutamate:Na+ symporter